MPEITYTGPVTRRIITVDGKELTFQHGEPTQVTEKQAHRILDDCPNEFVAVTAATPTTKED